MRSRIVSNRARIGPVNICFDDIPGSEIGSLKNGEKINNRVPRLLGKISRYFTIATGAALPDYVPSSLRETCLREYVAEAEFIGDAEALRREVIAVSLARDHRWHGC